MTWRNGMVILLAVLAAAVVPAAAQDEPQGGAYERLDPNVLARRLSEFGMQELLETFVTELGAEADSVESWSLLAQMRVAQANNVGDPDEKVRLLTEATNLFEKVVDGLGRPESDDDRMEMYRAMLQWGDAGALQRAEPAAQRLLMLQGGPADREAVREYTGDLLAMLTNVAMDIEVQLQDWRQEPVKLVTVVPELENLETTLRYKLSWIRFYRAVALPAGAEKAQLLADAMGGMYSYTRESADLGIRQYALLLTGTAMRERALAVPAEGEGYRRQATEMLTTLVNLDGADAYVRFQGLFQRVRTRIEAGEFAEAEGAIGNLQERGRMLLGSGAQLQLDLHSTLLRNYLHEVRASRTDDAEEKARQQLLAQQALLNFLNDHGQNAGVRRAFMDIIANRYAAREDYEQLNSLVLLAVATQANAGGDDRKALDLLDRILQRDDEITRRVRPLALWQAALILNQRRQNTESARRFAALAKEYPDHAYAETAALNAAITYGGVFQEFRERGRLISPELRNEFVEAITLLLDRWPDKPKAVPYWFDLGWQYDRLAETSAGDQQAEYMRKAVEAYQKVPSHERFDTVGPSLYMNARKLALELRAALARENPSATEEAGATVSAINDYVRDAAAMIEARSDDAELVADLRNWAAQVQIRKAAILHDVLDRPDDALAALDDVAERWSGADAVKDARAMQIRWLVDSDTSAAIDELEAFRQDYPPEESQELVKLLVAQIRRAIGELAEKPDAEAELERYRQVYLRFSEILYNRAREQDLSPEQIYVYRQMYAEAMLENGRAEEALDQFRACAEQDSAKREKTLERLTESVDQRVEALEAAEGDPDELVDVAQGYFADLERYGLNAESLGAARIVRRSLDYLEAQEEPEQRGAAAERLARDLDEAYENLMKILEQSVSVDATNIRGLAEANLALGNYKQAVEHYDKLIPGLDSNEYPKLYWQAQLGRAQAFLRGFGDRPKTMAALATLIRQLQLRDANMGGYAEQFNAIQAEAASRAQAEG